MHRILTVVDLVFPFGPFFREVEHRTLFAGWQKLLTRTLPLTFFFHWLFSFLPFGGLLYFLALLPVAFVRRLAQGPDLPLQRRYALLLWYVVVVIGGFGQLRGFIGHFFLSDMVASGIGWQTGSPFQIELAFFELGVSLAALLAIWLRANLVEGLAVVLSVFGLGAAYVHLEDLIVNGNASPYNTGSVLVGDIVVPSVLLILLFLEFHAGRNANSLDQKGRSPIYVGVVGPAESGDSNSTRSRDR